jgi:hypothetical protein
MVIHFTALQRPRSSQSADSVRAFGPLESCGSSNIGNPTMPIAFLASNQMASIRATGLERIGELREKAVHARHLAKYATESAHFELGKVTLNSLRTMFAALKRRQAYRRKQ